MCLRHLCGASENLLRFSEKRQRRNNVLIDRLSSGARLRFLGGFYISRPKLALRILFALAMLLAVASGASAATLAEVIHDVQPRMVKIYGAGGFKGLEAYQSGFLISSEGNILTVWSYVLDTEFITVMLDDGRRFE